jgi:hypothetical protein
MDCKLPSSLAKAEENAEDMGLLSLFPGRDRKPIASAKPALLTRNRSCANDSCGAHPAGLSCERGAEKELPS